MAEVRVDPLSGLRVLYAPGELGSTPGAGDAPPPVEHHPALTPDAVDPPREASLDLFTSAAARGAHERVEHAGAPGTALAAHDPEALVATLGGWRERMAAHPGALHVHLGVQEPAGTGHAELWALPFVPAAVARERERSAAYTVRTQGSDLLGDLVQAEVRMRERLVGYDDEAVLLAPYASRVPFQLMLVPRTPAPRFEAPGPLGAGLLHRALRALEAHAGAPVAFALWVRTAPQGAEHFSWRIDLLPALAAPGVLELGTGVPVNPVLPERAAAELRPLAAA